MRHFKAVTLLRQHGWPEGKWVEYPDNGGTYFYIVLMLDMLIGMDLYMSGLMFTDNYDGVTWDVIVHYSNMKPQKIININDLFKEMKDEARC